MPEFCSFLLQNSVDFKLEKFFKFNNFLEQMCSSAEKKTILFAIITSLIEEFRGSATSFLRDFLHNQRQNPI